MCGRFALKETPQKLAEHFYAATDLDFSPAFNIAPASHIITITADQEEHRHLRQMRWGLIPSWAKDPSIGNKLANARGETVHEKPSFRSAFKYRRCIIPASGFYEWKTEAGKKNPRFISLKSGEPLAMAGLWETWQPEGGDAVQTCCIITTEGNELMQPIHDRMPVLLDRDQWGVWLSQDVKQADLLLPMVRPHEPESMQAWSVSRELNRVGLRDDDGLIERL
ncbi:MAG: SOS response-associated peptidase [Sideroxydans sp.]